MLQSSDVGNTVEVSVTASNASGSNSATSAPTSVISSGGGLPSGVSLVAIDGDTLSGDQNATPGYYCKTAFGATVTPANNNACLDGWDSATFFPIGPFWGTAGEQSTWTSVGWNTEFYTTSQSDVSALGAAGLFSIPAASVTPNSDTVGFDAADEPGSWSAAASPLGSTANSSQDGRFWYVNNTWNMAQYGPPTGTPSPSTQAAFFDSKVATPNGNSRYFNIGSFDLYWFALANPAYEYNSMIEGGDLYNQGGNLTVAEAECGCRYGDMIRDVFGTSVGLPAGKSQAGWQTRLPRRSFSTSRITTRSNRKRMRSPRPR